MDSINTIDALYSRHPVIRPKAIYDVQNCSRQFGAPVFLLRRPEIIQDEFFRAN